MTSDTSAGDPVLGTLGSAGVRGVVHLEDRYDTNIDDLWSALTNPLRLARWLGDVQGDLRLDGEFHALFFASGWEGTGRVEACNPPHFLRVLTTEADSTDVHTIEATLTADGRQTVLIIEERGMPLDLLAAYGAGIQVHVEDLAAYLAGNERCDAQSRWAQLLPGYESLLAATG